MTNFLLKPISVLGYSDFSLLFFYAAFFARKKSLCRKAQEKDFANAQNDPFGEFI
jgi:hypothetical protein